MAINFPNAPNVGDFYNPPGSPFTYQWNGTGWVIPPSTGAGGGDGEVNTGNNVGGAAGVFKDKNNEVLNFRSIISNDASIDVFQELDTINIQAVDQGGEANTGANVGTGTGDVFRDKTGTTLNMRRLRSSDASVLFTTEVDSVDIRAADQGGEANTAANVGTGAGKVFRDKVGAQLNFKSIRAEDATIVVTNEADTIAIRSTVSGGGETNTGTNLGTGADVFAQKVGVALQFRSLVSGDASVSFTENANDIDIRATGAGGGETNNGSNIGTGDAGVFAQKNGVNLEFRRFYSSDATMTISEEVDRINLRAVDQGGEANTGANAGGGTGNVFRDKVGTTLNFKTLLQGTGVTITDNASDITIAASGIQAGDSVSWTGRHNMPIEAVTSAATTAFNWANGNKKRCALSTSITTVNLTNPGTADATFSITFKQAAGSTHTVTGWPASVKWIDGTAPDFSTLGNSEYMRVDFEYDAVDGVYIGTFGATG